MSKKSPSTELHNFEMELSGEESAWISATAKDGFRYHVWVTTVEPLRITDGWLYQNPPAGINGNARRYPLGTRFVSMDAIAGELLAVANRDGLLQKARDKVAAERTADAVRRAEEEREERLREDAPEMRDLLGRLIKVYEDVQSDTEGRYPSADHGCIECTLGTVPNHLNTGPCAYHRAKTLLRSQVEDHT
jgi:hypothetical protein